MITSPKYTVIFSERPEIGVKKRLSGKLISNTISEQERPLLKIPV